MKKTRGFFVQQVMEQFTVSDRDIMEIYQQSHGKRQKEHHGILTYSLPPGKPSSFLWKMVDGPFRLILAKRLVSDFQ